MLIFYFHIGNIQHIILGQPEAACSYMSPKCGHVGHCEQRFFSITLLMKYKHWGSIVEIYLPKRKSAFGRCSFLTRFHFERMLVLSFFLVSLLEQEESPQTISNPSGEMQVRRESETASSCHEKETLSCATSVWWLLIGNGGLYKNKEEGQLTLYTHTTSCYSMHVCSVSVLLFILGVAADVQNRPQNRAYFTVGIVFDICLVREKSFCPVTWHPDRKSDFCIPFFMRAQNHNS